jgi:glutamate--cysteine ligase
MRTRSEVPTASAAAAGHPIAPGTSAAPPSIDALVSYFRSAAKPAGAFRAGVEQEKIGVLAGGRPIPYQGSAGIAEILARLAATRGFTAQAEDGHIIALARDGDRITVEPGGQLELSGGAQPTAIGCRDALLAHVAEVREIGAAVGARFIGVGARPFGTLDEIPWLPKRRYGVMRSYFPQHGRQSRLAHYMMKVTATVQANFDYASEEEACDKIRTAYGVTSIVTALYAASPITESRPNGYKSFRAAVWLETDEDRCGLLPFVFEPGFSFRDYVEWALDVPMFFVVRDGHYRPAGAITFRRFMREGFEGLTATMADWEVHLSTLFPEVRLKRYIEVRGADAGPLPMAVGLAALWRGLLDDAEARAQAWRLVDGHPFAAREDLRRAVPRAGLAARLGDRPLRDLAVELCRIAGEGLHRLPGGDADRALLEPLAAYAAAGRSPADDLLDDFTAERGDPDKLIKRWEL